MSRDQPNSDTAQDFHLCEVVVDWEDGMDTEYLDDRKCVNEAVGKYRFESEHGVEMEEWLCDTHREIYDEAIIEQVETA